MISEELAKMMGEESEHTAVFGSIMRWEWAKRLSVKEAKKFLGDTQCPLCIRHGRVVGRTHICGNEKCTFYEICPCPKHDSLYEEVKRALRAGNEKDWKKYSAQLCNALWACWNKLFEKEPEKTYKIGDRFKNCGEYYKIYLVDNFVCNLINLQTHRAYSEPVNIKNAMHITQEEFDKMCDDRKGKFTLIE